MMLGDILALARGSGATLDSWLMPSDPELAQQLQHAVAREQTDLNGYLGLAVADFTEHASEEDWATLISRLRNAEDPAQACVLTMIRWRLAASAVETTDEPREKVT